MRQHSFWSWEMSVSMSAVGFAALALAAGLWALRKARKGGGRRRLAPTVHIPSLSEVSDDEEDDLWDHVASILESRRRSGASVQAKQSVEEDEEVWRIVEQIVSSRKHSHPGFQSPEKASSLSVNELRRWFESQAGERADSVDGQSENGHCENGQCKNGQCKNGQCKNGQCQLGRKENGHWDESNGKVNGVSDETVNLVSYSSEQRLEGASLLGDKGDVSGVSEAETKGAALVAASNGSGGHERPPASTPPRVKKIVRRQKSPPKEFQDLEGPPVSSLVGEDQESDEIESNEVDLGRNGGSDSSQNSGSVLSRNGSTLGQKEGSVIRQNEGSISIPNEKSLLGDGYETGGPGYQGPPGGEERVVVYMTSMRAVRKTFEECTTVRHIFNGFSIAVDERDISIHLPYRQELRDLMGGRLVTVPQVFIRGKHIGGLQEVRYLTDEKKMHKLIEGMPKIKVTEECEGCGGGRFLPCIDCRGSRKILVDEKVEACTECNEYGLIRCPMCA